MRPAALLLAAAPLWALSACGSTVAATPADASLDAAPDASMNPDAAPDVAPDVAPDAPPRVSVVWSPCPLHSEGDGPDAECADVAVPLDRARPTGPNIRVHVKRYHPEGGRSLRALWMLQGGPGASGWVFEGLSEVMATRFPDVDYYIPDHRGTGGSTRLGCAAQEADDSEGGLAITEAEWPACIASLRAEHGEGLASFNVTNAANDLGLLIEATRRDGQRVIVLGASYGTYLAHRYLQLFPRQADGVVFDSTAPPGSNLFEQDADAHEAARDFFAACGADSFCASKLGADPWSVATRLFDRLRAGHCPMIAVPAAPTHVLFRRAFGSMLMDPSLRAYVPAVVYRTNRCEARDIGALRVFMRAITTPQPPNENLRQWSFPLTHNIVLSEFSPTPPPTREALAAIREGAVASRDVTDGLSVNLGRWPVYTPDAFARGWAETDTPVLFLQGGLDPATLLRKARVMREHFTRPHQTWVEVPTATHTVIASSPFIDEAGEPRSCGTRLLMRFAEDPTAPLDTSCVAQVRPIDFTLPNMERTRGLFGGPDAWE
ncbi:MAG: alpha/beta fold hydrolase [Polyangiales bacterium]